MSTTKINDILIKKLFSTEEKIVLQAIDEVKNTGNSNYIPSLIELLFLQNNEEIVDQIIKLLSDVKQPEAADEFVKALQNPRYTNLYEIILSSCWQNGLDFSKHLKVFAKFLLHADYMVAFEAYTVIQNTDELITKEDSDEILSFLRSSIQSISDERKIFLQDSIDYITTISMA